MLPTFEAPFVECHLGRVDVLSNHILGIQLDLAVIFTEDRGSVDQFHFQIKCFQRHHFHYLLDKL